MVTALKVIRLSRQLTQAKAAELTGVSPSWYSMIETGRLQPTNPVKERLSRVFGKPADELLKPITLENVV